MQCEYLIQGNYHPPPWNFFENSSVLGLLGLHKGYMLQKETYNFTVGGCYSGIILKLDSSSGKFLYVGSEACRGHKATPALPCLWDLKLYDENQSHHHHHHDCQQHYHHHRHHSCYNFSECKNQARLIILVFVHKIHLNLFKDI